MSPEVQRCADAVHERRASISDFIRAFERLTKETSERTGVELPEAWKPCDS